MRRCWSFLVALVILVAAPRITAAERRVVLLVWDGMRPDSVTPEYTPNLWALAQEGVVFEHHHPVFFSSTEVNGAALGTGAHPSHGGIMANKEYRPRINPLLPVAIEDPGVVRRGDQVSGGHYELVPTAAEILHGRTPALRTVVAGAKPVVWLLDRGVLHDPKRPITANREPGRCCDTGCTAPGQAVMVPLPGGRK